eukprot:TRINITY_DN52283_c0_g1_i1.p1 TRINITY_DN52283_c0_g1~~TRINITY_DN52283_c0_g1_i1.p1  ORF type:complete len:361 (+),score=28.82 TRINITY_DN52283_c0_g1_i1:84-1166(+)
MGCGPSVPRHPPGSAAGVRHQLAALRRETFDDVGTSSGGFDDILHSGSASCGSVSGYSRGNRCSTSCSSSSQRNVPCCDPILLSAAAAEPDSSPGQSLYDGSAPSAGPSPCTSPRHSSNMRTCGGSTPQPDLSVAESVSPLPEKYDIQARSPDTGGIWLPPAVHGHGYGDRTCEAKNLVQLMQAPMLRRGLSSSAGHRQDDLSSQQSQGTQQGTITTADALNGLTFSSGGRSYMLSTLPTSCRSLASFNLTIDPSRHSGISVSSKSRSQKARSSRQLPPIPERLPASPRGGAAAAAAAAARVEGTKPYCCTGLGFDADREAGRVLMSPEAPQQGPPDALSAGSSQTAEMHRSRRAAICIY